MIELGKLTIITDVAPPQIGDICCYLEEAAGAPMEFELFTGSMQPLARQREIAYELAERCRIRPLVLITNSDTIVRTINQLIMLGTPDPKLAGDEPRLARLAEKYNVPKESLLNIGDVRAYQVGKPTAGDIAKGHSFRLIPLVGDDLLGFSYPAMDDVINDMNALDNDVIWGEDE